MRSKLDEFGREIFSGEVKTLPVHFTRQMSVHDQVRQMVLAMRQAEVEGYETFEDADDFEVGDDYYNDEKSGFPNYENEPDFDHFPESDSALRSDSRNVSNGVQSREESKDSDSGHRNSVQRSPQDGSNSQDGANS